MSMQDNAVMGESRIGSHYLPDIRKCRNALVIFLLLQVYFTGNILSFGFWKSELVVFGYLAMFYGVWLVGLSLPLCFGLWLQTLEVRPDTLWWVAIPIISAMFVYYRFGVLYIGKVSVLMVPLCIVSFLGHADIFAGPEHSSERVSAETDMVSLDRETNIHVIVFDSLTHSAFSGRTPYLRERS